MKKLIAFILPTFLLFLLISFRNRAVVIVDIVDSLPFNFKWPYRSLDSITDISIHHSATTSGSALSYAISHNKKITKKGNKWGGIGYHFVIDRDGTINKTNPLTANSYHNGYNNSVAVGICVTGNFEIQSLTPDQEVSIFKLVEKLNKDLKNVSYLDSHGDYPNASTKCAGSSLKLKVTEYRTYFNLSSRSRLSYSKNINFMDDDKINIYDESVADN